MPTVHDLSDHLAPILDRQRYHADGDPAGVWIGSDREIQRLGLYLEPGPALYDEASGVDALLIHRPFGLWPARLGAGVGVLAVHRALDDRLSIGDNPALADALGLDVDDEPLRRDGDRIGLVCRPRQRLLAEAFIERIGREFGGIEDAWGDPPEAEIEAVALVGAMTEPLVRSAAERGADIYVTGQLRKPARDAVQRTGLYAIAVGQDRAEAWGLRFLGTLLRQRWPEIEIVEVRLAAALSLWRQRPLAERLASDRQRRARTARRSPEAGEGAGRSRRHRRRRARRRTDRRRSRPCRRRRTGPRRRSSSGSRTARTG